MKASTREILRIAVPVSLEFIVMLGLNFITQVIVGSLGALAIASVAFANNITFILVITFGSLGSSVAILVARSFGAGKLHELNESVSVALAFSTIISLGFTGALLIAPHRILVLAGARPEVADTADVFLMYSAGTLLFNTGAAILSSVLRSTKRTKQPMQITAVSAVVSVALSAGLVHGFAGLPAMGVNGAGVAILASSVLKFLLLGAAVFTGERKLRFELPRNVQHWLDVVRPLLVFALPLAATELIWTGGVYGYGVINQRIGTDTLAASQISFALEGLFITASFGLASAATTLIGQSVGSKDAASARRWLKEIQRLALISSLAFSVLYASSALTLGWLYPNVDHSVRSMAIIAILINAAMQVFKVRNMLYGVAVLSSGNDMRGIVMGDATGVAVGTSSAILLGLILDLGIVGVMLGRSLEEIAKLGVFQHRVNRIDWDRQIALQD